MFCYSIISLYTLADNDNFQVPSLPSIVNGINKWLKYIYIANVGIKKKEESFTICDQILLILIN